MTELKRYIVECSICKCPVYFTFTKPQDTDDLKFCSGCYQIAYAILNKYSNFETELNELDLISNSDDIANDLHYEIYHGFFFRKL